ncbi:general transcription factor IIH subunit 5-like [Cricetulus griseus]|uniref:General transcription and DNA repair factor IIH subunit TFB5 n=2 Tax=Cricetulus griseus TaxID=10029 RepID=A0A9J7H7K1_CRIGR|nr:general transcription factor IIH subunit 5-like [Cricetulus griseus]XP_035311962.1 general transcription factor IIH subunit 5-like [Cricetulus griseus]
MGHETAVDLTRQDQEMFSGIAQFPKRLPKLPKVVVIKSRLPADESSQVVNVLRGVLIECDPAMKQFLLYLDESNALGKKFIIQDIDDTHVFVIAKLVNVLQERVRELMDQNAFSLTQK